MLSKPLLRQNLLNEKGHLKKDLKKRLKARRILQISYKLML